MTERTYAFPPGGLPPQSQLLTGRAVFTNAYAVIPKGCLSDIVTSRFPHWDKTRGWILARPLSGFAETFSQIVMEIEPGGGATMPETDPLAEGAYFVLAGTLTLAIANQSKSALTAGGFAYLPPGAEYKVTNAGETTARVVWIRKPYEAVAGLGAPSAFVSSDDEAEPQAMPDTNGAWATSHFMDPDDLAHDMHVTIVTLQPGAVIPFAETHVMEHGLYVLQGKGVYLLNTDWVEVEAGDFMWLRAFCPQACYAGGPEPFRYLLYKDVNRLPRLAPPVSPLGARQA
ncbi:MAG: bifunctional allantoicase/(S)-ureidoglycine aminohydrolase [Pseudomonadota bacterium]